MHEVFIVIADAEYRAGDRQIGKQSRNYLISPIQLGVGLYTLRDFFNERDALRREIFLFKRLPYYGVQFFRRKPDFADEFTVKSNVAEFQLNRIALLAMIRLLRDAAVIDTDDLSAGCRAAFR